MRETEHFPPGELHQRLQNQQRDNDEAARSADAADTPTSSRAPGGATPAQEASDIEATMDERSAVPKASTQAYSPASFSNSDIEATIDERTPSLSSSDIEATIDESSHHGVSSDVEATIDESSGGSTAVPKSAEKATEKPTVLGESTPGTDSKQRRKLGKFDILEKLGAGGMGDVFKGWHPDLDIPVAIKTIKENRADSGFFVNRFIREARLATKLSHQNVVRVYDVDKHDGTYFIVQEFVDGDDLHKILANTEGNKMPLNQALDIVIGIARALVEMEKHNIVHRDIKPSNILVTKDGIPKLADLGLAKQYFKEKEKEGGEAKDAYLTQSGSSLGSPAYMAPEQVVDAATVDIRADIYCLGVTFYHMVTGKLPFTGRSTNELMLNKMKENAPDPGTVDKEVPPDVGQIIVKMMQNNAADRYQTARELLDALEAVRRPQINKTLLYLGIAAAIVIIAALVGSNFYFAQRPQTTIVEDPFAVIEQGLATRDYDGVIQAITERFGTDTSECQALYALGLCYLNRDDKAQLETVVSKLEAVPDGTERAQHLRILQELRDNSLDTALTTIDNWTPKIQHKLPYLHLKGVVFQRKNDYAQAETAFNEALQQASFFNFQRLAVFDDLGRLYAARGEFERARDVYTKAVAAVDTKSVGSSDFHTNRAVTEMNTGDSNAAAESVKQALEVNPSDEVALYLQKKLAEKESQSTIDRIKATMDMIKDVGQQISSVKDKVDRWTSTPLIITILPLENANPYSGRLGVENMWGDELVDALHGTTAFPVVDRDSLEAILREHQLSASELGSNEARLKLGSILPASILARGSMQVDGDTLTMTMRLIDVQTSEVVGILNQQVTNGQRGELWGGLATKIDSTLRDSFPVRGTIVSGESGVFEINVGKCHGLSKNHLINIYQGPAQGSARLLARKPPLATAQVTDMDKFSAVIQVQDPGAAVQPGWIFLADTAKAP